MASDFDDNMPLPPFRQGEIGTLGLHVINGRMLQEPRRNLRFPESMQTYQMMMRDPAIAASLNIIKMFVRRVDWEFKPPKGKEKDTAFDERVKFFTSLMDDMDNTWHEFINSVMTMCIYGFSVHEKVYKTRKGRSGKYPSKFNDGLIGWAKLPIRAQGTLDKWYFDDDYTQMTGVRQNLYRLTSRNLNLEIKDRYRRLPRSKFLLFRYDDDNGSPEGRSPLLNAYVPWKYKVQIEEHEAVGVSRDLVGMPKIGLPPDYLDENAEPEKKAFVEYCKKVINDMIANDRAGIIWPRFIDPETKMDIFEFSLVSRQGAKAYDTDAIIDRYSKQIMMAFMSDVLAMGNSKYGSFSLADNKTSLLAMSVEILLKQIQDVINKDLIPQTYTLNQWTDEEQIQICFTDIETPDIEAIAKFMQQVVAVGAMEVDKASSDYLRSLVGLPPADESAPVSEKLSPNSLSKSGEGMKTGGEGTAKTPSAKNTSTANKANK
ncbi:portal protein [Yersinia phage vB_YenM_P778]